MGDPTTPEMKTEFESVDLGPVDASRELICEGPCNPLIRDYDELRERYTIMGASELPTIAEWVRELVHTLHERVRTEHWDTRGGWIRTYRCSRCGHTRKF